MTALHELGIAQAAQQIRARQISAAELMDALLARCRALDADLKVWVTLDAPAAQAAARRRDAELQSEGPRGPLHGIPVGVKDIYYTRGIPTTCGSPIFADFIPDHDATTVALLKRAGAIIMGKTVTTEFACGDPAPTVNPWNAAHTPGGSSSGSAVGCAVRMFPASLGSQTAGSILRPAAYNGVVGFKPTFGRVSRHGVYPVSQSLDTMGTFTRSVADAALLLTALAGHDPADPDSSSQPIADYSQATHPPETPPRIGVIPQFFLERCDDEVRAHTAATTRALAQAGADLHEIALPTDFDSLLAAHRALMTVEGANVHRRNFAARPNDYSPNVRQVIEQGIATPALTYLQAKNFQRQFTHDAHKAMSNFDALLTPATYSPAPAGRETTGNPMFQTPWTFGGFPALTLPSGLSARRLPLGIQLIAPHFAEPTLLATAAWCEQALNITLQSPL